MVTCFYVCIKIQQYTVATRSPNMYVFAWYLVSSENMVKSDIIFTIFIVIPATSVTHNLYKSESKNLCVLSFGVNMVCNEAKRGFGPLVRAQSHQRHE